jgi:wyosine [tRNA(Phe)-imidazoG37] synthetase (radical SAM superfamily)
MNEYKTNIVFGPVPSRRLGRSLGINNIIPKRCSYSCIYCQLGRTSSMQITRESFYDPEIIIQQTTDKIERTKKSGQKIEYITLVSDGEPTLDEQLGDLIAILKRTEYPIAVITNSSLLHLNDVRKDLEKADWVSVKIDTISNTIWRKINRPHGSLNLEQILEGINYFSEQYSGNLVTETMIVKNINDDESSLQKLAEFISSIHPKKSYLSIPTRPPAEPWVESATEKTLTQAYQSFTNLHIPTEYLIGYEGNEFAFTGNAKQDLLSITAVHPMRQDALEHFLEKAGEDFRLVERLIKEQKIVKHTLKKSTFYTRKLMER